MLKLCATPSLLTEICWVRGKSAWSVFWGPRSGGSLGDCTHVQFFFNQLQQMLGICRSTFAFLVMCEQPLTATPRGSDPFPDAQCELRVVKRQHKSKSRGSLVKAPHPQDTTRKTETPWKGEKLYFLECKLKRQIIGGLWITMGTSSLWTETWFRRQSRAYTSTSAFSNWEYAKGLRYILRGCQRSTVLNFDWGGFQISSFITIKSVHFFFLSELLWS